MGLAVEIVSLDKDEAVAEAREDLIDAVLRLYDAKGYERTRVEREELRPLVRRLAGLRPGVYGPGGIRRSKREDSE